MLHNLICTEYISLIKIVLSHKQTFIQFLYRIRAMHVI